MATFCIEMWMIQFLKDQMSSVFSDLYEMKKLNKSHKSYYAKIVLCKTALIQLEKDLCKRIYKREICKDVLW